MTCRTEKKRISLSSERVILNIYSNCIGSLVLESECNVVLHTILGLISSLHFSISFFKQLLMLWGNSDNKICRAIFISHIVLSLNKMLSKSSPDLTIGILVELKHTLRLGSIAKALVCKCLGKDRLSVLRARAHLVTEKLRSVESERLDLIDELSCRSIIRNRLTFLKSIKTTEKILEHTRCSAGSRNELAFAIYGSRLIVLYSCFNFLLTEYLYTLFRSSRSNDLHPRETLLETLHLICNCLDCCTSLLNLSNIFFSKHTCLSYLLVNFLCIFLFYTDSWISYAQNYPVPS